MRVLEVFFFLLKIGVFSLSRDPEDPFKKNKTITSVSKAKHWCFTWSFVVFFSPWW